jgi:hypothetical protein
MVVMLGWRVQTRTVAFSFQFEKNRKLPVLEYRYTHYSSTRVQSTSIHPVVSPWSISVQNWPLTTDHSRHLLIKWTLTTDRLTSKKCMIQYGDHVDDHENIRVRVRVRGQNPWSTQQKKLTVHPCKIHCNFVYSCTTAVVPLGTRTIVHGWFLCTWVRQQLY